jgi:hypothetical protein
VEVVEMFTQNSGAKRFKIFVVPTVGNGFNSFCFQFIGQGASFCTSRNCAVLHHHALVKAVKPGDVYVAKGSSTVFVLPFLGDSVLQPEVLAKWKYLSLNLPEWNEKFFIATSASDKALPASTEAIEQQEEFFRTKALNFKTPAKRRFDSNEDQDTPLLELDVRPHSPFFRDDEEAPITEIAHVSGVLARLDEGVMKNNEALLVLTDKDYRLEHRKAGDAISLLWLQMEALSAALGTAPARLALEYMAPSAWASIGAMAATLDALGSKLKLIGPSLVAYKLEVTAWCETTTSSPTRGSITSNWRISSWLSSGRQEH